MQATNVTYDPDTGILDLRLDTGEEFRVTDAFHARRIKSKVSPGGRISKDQYEWIKRYRVELRNTNRDRLRAILKAEREKLRGQKSRKTPPHKK